MRNLIIAAAIALSASIASADIINVDVALTPEQEVPTPTLDGATPSGQATVTFDTATREVTITGSYTGMTSNVVGSHLHGLAGPGATAGVVFGLANTGGTDGTFSGNSTLSESDFQGLLDGMTYINIHTSNNGPGEIRGQVVPEPATAALLLGAAACMIRRRR